MADFRKALRALGRGRLDRFKLAESIDQVLSERPELSEAMLRQLDRARDEGELSETQYDAIRECITTLPLPAAENHVAGNNAENDDSDKTRYPSREVDDLRRNRGKAPARDEPSGPASKGRESKSAKPETPPSGDSTILIALEPDPSPHTDASLPSTSNIDIDLSGGGSFFSVDSEFVAGLASGSGVSSVAHKTVSVGSVLRNRYVLAQQIGKGGMGTVYKALDLLREEAEERHPYVAVKVLNEDFRRHPKAFIALAREATRQSQLAHRNIVRVQDFDRDEGDVAYMVMELLDGEPLNHYLRGLPAGLKFEEAWPIVRDLGQALAYAHEKGFVHSDFKPGNCHHCADGTAKVLDFGIARAVPRGDLQTGVDGSGETTRFRAEDLGALTEAYASLEMLQGEPPDPRDDIYALACVTYQLLELRHPFDKMPADKAMETGRRPPPAKNLTARQWRGLARGLAFKREDRSPDVTTFLNELQGRTPPLRNPWIIGPAAVVLIGLPLTYWTWQHIRSSHETALVEEIAKGKDSDFALLVKQIKEEPEDRLRIIVDDNLPQLETRLSRSFEAFLAVNDFKGAEEVLTMAQTLRKGWEAIGKARDRLDARRATRVGELETGIAQCRARPECLVDMGPNGFSQLVVALSSLKPDHALLNKETIATLYATQLRGAMDKRDLDLAVDLRDAALKLTPGNPQITGMQRELQAIGASLETELATEEAAKELSASLSQLSELTKLQQALRLAASLLEHKPDHPALATAATAISAALARQVDSLTTARRWTDLRSLVDNSQPLEAVLGLNAVLSRALTQLQGFDKRTDELMAQVDQIVASERVLPSDAANALKAMSALAEHLGDEPRVADKRTLMQSTLLSKARRARRDGEFAMSGDLLATGRKLGGSDQFIADLEGAEKELDAAKTGKDQADKAAQLVRDIKTANDEFLKLVADMPSTQSGISKALRLLEDVQTLEPSGDTAKNGRDKILKRIGEQVDDAMARGEFDQALKILDGAEQAKLELTSALDGRRAEVLARKQDADKNRELAGIKETKAALEKLLADARFDAAWDSKIASSIQTLEKKVQPDDHWAADFRQRAAAAYEAEIKSRIESKNFDGARNLSATMAKSTLVVSNDTSRQATLRKQIDGAESAWKASRLAAEVEERKARTRTLIEAGNFTEARKTFETLKSQLAADDTFAKEAEQLFSKGYRTAAENRPESEPDKALALVLEGLQFSPKDSPLLELQQKYHKRVYDLALRDMKESKEADPSHLKWLVNVLSKSQPAQVSELNAALEAAARTRIAGKNEEQCGVEVVWVKKVLPVVQLAPCKETPVGLPAWVTAVQTAVSGGKLSEAQAALAQVADAERKIPDFSALEAKIKELKAAADTRLALLREAAEKCDRAGSETAYTQLREMWADGPQSDWQALVNKSNCPPPPVADNSCIADIAGRGKTKKGQCFDTINGAAGPVLVVAPAGNGLPAFAIGRYEVRVEEFNRYCSEGGKCTALSDGKNQPATGITLEQADGYLAWLSSEAGHKYRLPTSAEWEYAARAGGGGDGNPNCRVMVNGSIMKGFKATSVLVGVANPWGLLNAVGNIQEWVEGGKARGGAYSEDIGKCSPALEKEQGGTADAETGFRVARDL